MTLSKSVIFFIISARSMSRAFIASFSDWICWKDLCWAPAFCMEKGLWSLPMIRSARSG